jgi:hypothetical protein
MDETGSITIPVSRSYTAEMASFFNANTFVQEI